MCIHNDDELILKAENKMVRCYKHRPVLDRIQSRVIRLYTGVKNTGVTELINN